MAGDGVYRHCIHHHTVRRHSIDSHSALTLHLAKRALCNLLDDRVLSQLRRWERLFDNLCHGSQLCCRRRKQYGSNPWSARGKGDSQWQATNSRGNPFSRICQRSGGIARKDNSSGTVHVLTAPNTLDVRLSLSSVRENSVQET